MFKKKKKRQPSTEKRGYSRTIQGGRLERHWLFQNLRDPQRGGRVKRVGMIDELR